MLLNVHSKYSYYLFDNLENLDNKRGITPPHRVKSISMATFTNEEIELLKNRGNEYCRKVWLGLHEGAPPSATGDDQTTKDFMVEKYERRRYYLDPSLGKPEVPNTRPLTQLVSDPKPVKVNGVNGALHTQSTLRTRPEVNRNNNRNNNKAMFIADFDKADIFSSAGNGSLSTKQQNGNASFANFDNNPVFSNTTTSTTTTTNDFSIFDLSFTESNGPVLNQVPLFPKCNTNRWSMPTPATINNMNNWNNHQNNTNMSLNGSLNNTLNGILGAPEDKYAALKDLDNEIKSQKNFDWSSTSSNGQFLTAFPSENGTSGISNPFSNGGGVNWGTNNVNGFQQSQQSFANPFKDTAKTNGFSQVFQPISTYPANGTPMTVNGTNGWTPNPFKVG
ncbi:hypothetical protein NQ317_010182 [Molorchus minor]|uniref:Arf-GAP domain-containing protein n=1 Tax=Molorchus minor TaxID=1323400 RepID=A0ABQ9JXI5_9CUCU|nr:hypothetical protein NQ317_010182 [Molorchus minor]